MGPKKGGKKAEVKPAISEIDKAFFELKLADANRKLSALRTEYGVLENRLNDVTNDLKKLDADRADVISYLERTLDQRTKEIAELQSKILDMERDRDSEIQVYKDQVVQVQREYRIMRQDLSSQMKLLKGKLNSLEEFRAQRNALMAKFDKQESDMEEQEERHKRLLYEAERKFIISKDTLKKEMENRLLQLSNDFQRATEMRIATTTHRVIHENIALNNEFELMQETIQRLQNENDNYQKRDKELTMELDISEETKKRMTARAEVQDMLLNKLTIQRRQLIETILKYTHLDKSVTEKNYQLMYKDNELKLITKRMNRAGQDIHMIKCEKCNVETTLANTILEKNRLEDIIYNCEMTLKTILKRKRITRIRKRLTNVLDILHRIDEEYPQRAASLATVSVHSLPPAKERSVIEVPKVKPLKYVRNVDDKTTRITDSLRKMPAFIRTGEEEGLEEEEEEEEEEEVVDEEESSEESICSPTSMTIEETLVHTEAEASGVLEEASIHDVEAIIESEGLEEGSIDTEMTVGEEIAN